MKAASHTRIGGKSILSQKNSDMWAPQAQLELGMFGE